ncbi:MAG: hypothetical protein RXO36_05335 [Candidatus Nanopusillus acidilobi]
MKTWDNIELVFTSIMSFIFALLSNYINDFIPKMLVLGFIPFYLITFNWRSEGDDEK